MSLISALHSSTQAADAVRQERGAILILFAILGVCLFAFISLGVDTGLLSVSRRDHSNMAPKIASAALNALIFSDGATFDERLDDAILRAEEISQAAIDSAMTTYFVKGHTYLADIGTVDAPGETGYIEAGIWHFVPSFSDPAYFDPDSGVCTKVTANECPCANDGTWNGPCFESIDSTDFTPPPDPDAPFSPPRITSLRLSVHTRDDAPLLSRFSSVFGGQAEHYLESSAIVATRPLRIVFLYDLSRSAHQETHLPYEAAGVLQNPMLFNAAESAYRLTNKSCAASEPAPPNDSTTIDRAYVDGDLTCLPIAGNCNGAAIAAPAGPSDCQLAGGIAFGQANGAYNALYNLCNPFVLPPGKPANARATWHSKADYRCVSVTPTIDGSAQPSVNYLVDAFRNANTDGPEPLTTMLAAVQQSTQRFEARGIDGDMIAVVGFDQNVGIEERIFGPVQPDTTIAAYQNIKDVFDPAANFYLRNQDHIWFPREDAMLNVPDALKKAFTMLTADPAFHYSDNHIVLLSDGISECYTDDDTDEQVCAANQAAIQESLAESVAFAEEYLAEHKIKLNVLLVGGMVQPHTLVKKGRSAASENRCMQEDEARNLLTAGGDPEPWVNTTDNTASYADATTGASFDPAEGLVFADDARFHLPNILHEAVAATGGLWGVIRPACPFAPAPGGASCADGGLEAELDAECAAVTTPGDVVRNYPTAAGEIVDGDGRLVCDSLCRDRDEQIRAYTDKLFDSYPYLAIQSSIQVN